MIKKTSKCIFVFLFLFLLLIPNIAQTVDPIINGIKVVDKEIELVNEDPRTTTVRFVNIVLSFLGLIALIVVLFGGFKWMTSGGNQEQVGQAKKLLIAGLIGLIIVLLSWGISTYIITQVTDVTTYN